MGKAKKAIVQHFVCPKCRGSKGDAREIVLSKTRLLDLLPSKDNRYLEVTCMLCGYTEFYNRAKYLASLSPAKERAKLPLPEEAKGG